MSGFGGSWLIAIVAFLAATFLPPGVGRSGDSTESSSGVTGTVTSSETALPVARASLTLSPLGVAAVSDSDGVFTFRDVPVGTYTLSAKKAGFWPRRISDVKVAGERQCRLSISLQPRLYVLDEIVVSASRIDEPRAKAAEQATVLKSEQIRDGTAHDVAEALAAVPGLVIERDLGLGSNAYPSIRGSDPRHTLAVIDGIPLNSLVEGTADLSWIPREQVERIEVLKGASSAIWGSSLGGVIHITTRSPERSGRPHATPAFSLGEWRTRRASLGVEGSLGRVGYFASTSLLQTDGFRPETDVDIKSLFGKVTSPVATAGSAHLMVGHSEGEVGEGAFPDWDIWGSHEYEFSYGAFGVDVGSLAGADLKVDLGASNQRYCLFTFPLGSAEPMLKQEAKERSLCFSARAVWLRGEAVQWVSGIDANWSSLDSESVNGRRKTRQRALFTSADLHKGAGTYSLGLRFDHSSPFGSQLSPTVGAVYEIPEWRSLIRASCSRDFQSPLLSTKFFEDPDRGIVANPEIQPERAWVLQTAIESQPFSFLWTRCSVYRSDNRDAIDVFVDATTGLWMMKNFAHRRRQGGELELKAAFTKGLWVSTAAAFNDVRELPSGASFWTLWEGEIIKDRPRVVYNVGMGHGTESGLRVALTGGYIWWNASGDYKADDRKFIWDAEFSHRFPRLHLGSVRVFVTVHNIVDTPYSRTHRYPRPGRWLEGGFSCVL